MSSPPQKSTAVMSVGSLSLGKVHSKPHPYLEAKCSLLNSLPTTELKILYPVVNLLITTKYQYFHFTIEETVIKQLYSFLTSHSSCVGRKTGVWTCACLVLSGCASSAATTQSLSQSLPLADRNHQCVPIVPTRCQSRFPSGQGMRCPVASEHLEASAGCCCLPSLLLPTQIR